MAWSKFQKENFPHSTTTTEHKWVCRRCQDLRTAMDDWTISEGGTNERDVYRALERLNERGLWGDATYQWNRNYGAISGPMDLNKKYN